MAKHFAPQIGIPYCGLGVSETKKKRQTRMES